MSQCQSGKRAYPSVPDAWRVIAIQESPRWRKTHKRPATPRGTAYRGPFCGNWRLTHPRKNDRRPVRQTLYGEARP